MRAMLKKQDRDWLNERYPNLKITSEGIFGIVSFSAIYNDEKNRFYIINSAGPLLKGLHLQGEFEINIRERKDKSIFKLPILYVKGVDISMERHLNLDGAACLCSPFEEDAYFSPDLNFKLFFEQLVIPFLYGQIFYSKYNRWPWGDYGHKSAGLLESYFRLNDHSLVRDCLNKLSLLDDWKTMRIILRQKSDIKGHTLCLCGSGRHIRSCHPDAWAGVIKLRKDIKDYRIKIN